MVGGPNNAAQFNNMEMQQKNLIRQQLMQQQMMGNPLMGDIGNAESSIMLGNMMKRMVSRLYFYEKDCLFVYFTQILVPKLNTEIYDQIFTTF